jgi:hypothetical protein
MSVLDSFLAALTRIFTGAPPPAPAPAPSAPLDDSLKALTRRALVIVYDPVLDPATGMRLLQHPLARGWQNVDDLIEGYRADIEECSGGLIKYQVVGKQVADHFLKTESGFQYDPASYLDALSGRVKPNEKDLADYYLIVQEFDLLKRIANDEFDEVWMFAGPFMGFYEARMVGQDAFWCNSPPLANTTGRRFVMMGFSYERGVGEMLEDLGHRGESILTKAFERTQGDANLYQRFARYDEIAPGQAEVGLLHYAPNSERDYDWGNPRFVPSNCDAWMSFPELPNKIRQVNCAEWGNGDIRLHHKWWFDHLPKVAGSRSGILHNWWTYVIDPNQVK